MDAVIAPVLDENGKPKKYIGVRYDITAAELERHNSRGVLAAIDGTFAYIEYDVKGHVLVINDQFTKLLGHELADVVGKQHRIFVDTAYAGSPAYAQYWRDLNNGIPKAGVAHRVTKDGREIWIQSNCTPVKDEQGRILKFITLFTDVTAAQLQTADFQGQIAAIGRAQAVIEFNLDGTVITANDNFLNALGYKLAEIKGRHHSLFVDPAYHATAEYQQFWRNLNDGKFQTAEFKRIGKGGKEVWLQATYNPMFDIDGRVHRVIKFATDISARKMAERKLVTTIQTVSNNAQTLSSSSKELTAVSQQMSANSEETAAQANMVASASEQVTRNVSTVATAAEEMSASAKEIAKNASEAQGGRAGGEGRRGDEQHRWQTG